MTDDDIDSQVDYAPILSEEEFRASMEQSEVRNKAIDKIASSAGLSEEELIALGFRKTRIKEWPLTRKEHPAQSPPKKK